MLFGLKAYTERSMRDEVSDRVYEYVVSDKSLGNKEISKIKVTHDKKTNLYFSTVTFKDSSKPVHIIMSGYDDRCELHVVEE